MKTTGKLLTEMVGGLSLLALSATWGYAADYPSQACNNGTISEIEGGYHNHATWLSYCSRMIKMTCNDADTTAPLFGKSGTYCVYNTIDSDGILATALTAVAVSPSKVVKYKIYQGHTVPEGVWGNGLILSLSLVTGP